MMEPLRQLPRTVLVPLILVLAALLVLAIRRMDALSDLVDTSAISSLLSIGIGLTVAALVLSRVSARR